MDRWVGGLMGDIHPPACLPACLPACQEFAMLKEELRRVTDLTGSSTSAESQAVHALVEGLRPVLLKHRLFERYLGDDVQEEGNDSGDDDSPRSLRHRKQPEDNKLTLATPAANPAANPVATSARQGQGQGEQRLASSLLEPSLLNPQLRKSPVSSGREGGYDPLALLPRKPIDVHASI